MPDLSLVMPYAMKAIRMLEAFNLKRPQTLSAAVPASTTVDLFSNIRYTEADLLVLSITLFVVFTQNLRCMLSRHVTQQFHLSGIDSQTEIVLISILTADGAAAALADGEHT